MSESQKPKPTRRRFTAEAMANARMPAHLFEIVSTYVIITNHIIG